MSRFQRQLDLVPPEKMAEQRFLLIGAGAVGRNLGQSLAAVGAKDVTIVDFDTIETVNICTQGYNKEDVGKSKSETLANLMKKLDYEGDANFTADIEAWRPSKYTDHAPTIVISCVDSMACRNSIFKYLQRMWSVNLFVDCRMLGNTLRLLTYRNDNLSEYADTLFSDDEAEPGRCTAQSTMYAADTLANLAVGQICLHLRGFKGRKVYSIDLFSELLEDL